jgi:DNA-directed RNA polymerase specialized sigma24 family protein
MVEMKTLPLVSRHSSQTSWSVILQTRSDGKERTAAFDRLFRRYEKSVLALLRRSLLPPGETPEDVKQSFFARAMERGDFAGLDRQSQIGSFRAWLRISVTNFVRTLWEKHNAQKRGNQVTFPLDHDVACSETPERIFDRNFAATSVLYALERMREEEKDKATFDTARRFLPGHANTDTDGVAEFADAVKKTPNAAAVYLYRLRNRFARVLRDVVAETLDLDPDEALGEAAIDAELRDQCAALLDSGDKDA